MNTVKHPLRGQHILDRLADRYGWDDLVAKALFTFTNNFPSMQQLRSIVKNPLAYHYQHRDGLRCTMILFDGLLRDFNPNLNPPIGEPDADSPPIPRLHRAGARCAEPFPLGSSPVAELRHQAAGTSYLFARTGDT
jgi:hypothetical protein